MGKKKEVQEESVTLVKGISAELEAKATEIITSGIASGKSTDEVKQAVFGLGIPFSKLGKLVNEIMKKEGLSVNTKAVKSTITDLITKSSFTFDETLAELKEFANTVVANVQNASVPKVLSQLKAHWKLNEKEFPRKAAPVRGRIGAINKAVINAFKESPQMSCADLEAILAPLTKNPSGYAKSMYPMAYALVNGLSALEVLTVIAKAKE